MLKELLSKNQNRWQIVGASFGAFLGLFILLFASQLYFDFQKILRGSNDADNFITINKPISLVNTIFGKSVFSTENIKELENQSFTQQVTPFIANRFKASASSRMINFYTELFFEAVPESFIDVQDPQFRWFEGQGEVPIIMSKDYLALYNFGFALSQGLPQFTPSTIRQVTVDITLRGNSREQTFTGRIIGFSERINSILVPPSFMKWSNANFGDQPDQGASRLLLKVNDPYDKQLASFLKEKGYEISIGRLTGGRLALMLNISLFILSVIGVLMLILSIVVFILNYQLIISKSSQDIKLLLQIGYKAGQINEILRGTLFRILLGVFAAVVVCLGVARWAILSWVNQNGFELHTFYHWVVCLIGLVVFGLILFINARSIKKNIAGQF
jgi:uncharacterized membrane protein YidH (DUF202 family)